MKMYPHTATISYYNAGTTSSLGVYTPGTLVTVGIVCNIQPNAVRYIVGASGDRIGYNHHIFFPFSASEDDIKNIPDDAKINFNSKDHIIKQLFTYQKHIEVKC